LWLIGLQRSKWDPLGVDKDYGCQCLDRLPEMFPGDDEILKAREKFVCTAQETYLAALEDRRPASLEYTKPMPREAIIEFFDACNTRMDMPAFREALARHLRERRRMPNTLIVEAQKDLLEVIGFERDHGCRCLSNIPKDFPGDQEIGQRFQLWQRKAHQACFEVVKLHQAAGGEMPQDFSPPEEMVQMRNKAQEEIEKMTPQDRAEMLQKMRRKVEIFANLPPDARETHLKRLSEHERLEFVKAQMLLMGIMQDQWRSSKQGEKCEHGHDHAHDHAHSSASRPNAVPAQQEMM